MFHVMEEFIILLSQITWSDLCPTSDKLSCVVKAIIGARLLRGFFISATKSSWLAVVSHAVIVKGVVW